jgi:hypothetical protein
MWKTNTDMHTIDKIKIRNYQIIEKINLEVNVLWEAEKKKKKEKFEIFKKSSFFYHKHIF